MAAEWRHLSIGVLCDEGLAELQTGPFGSQLHAHDYVADGIAVVPTEAIRGRQIDYSVIPRINPAKAKSLERHRLRAGDILFARRGVQATGHIGYVRDSEEGFICGTGAIRLRILSGNSEVDPQFLSHVLANPASVAWFKFHAIGATMPNLNEGIIRAFPLKLPPLPEQRAIAHILSTLEDKIELNRRMNETLESMARGIFQSWFVDFDPVRAKAEGRDSSLPKDIADLFPDRFEDSELGEIPAGWEIGTLADFADLNPESWSKNTAPDEIKYLDLANVKWGKITETQTYLWKDAPSRAQRILRPGDTIVGTVRPGNGSFTLVAEEGLTGSTGFAVLRPREAIYNEYIYLASTSSDNIERLSHLADGAAYPAVRPAVVLTTQTLLPGELLIECFASAAKPLMAKIAANERESCTLAALRDALLPKLISGEIRVKDAEKFLEESENASFGY